MSKPLSNRSKKIIDNAIVKIYNSETTIGEVYNKCVMYGNSAFCYFIDELERLNMCYIKESMLCSNDRSEWAKLN